MSPLLSRQHNGRVQSRITAERGGGVSFLLVLPAAVKVSPEVEVRRGCGGEDDGGCGGRQHRCVRRLPRRPGPLVAEEERAEAHLLHCVPVGVRLALLVEHLVLGRAAATGYLAFWNEGSEGKRAKNGPDSANLATTEKARFDQAGKYWEQEES